MACFRASRYFSAFFYLEWNHMVQESFMLLLYVALCCILHLHLHIDILVFLPFAILSFWQFLDFLQVLKRLFVSSCSWPKMPDNLKDHTQWASSFINESRYFLSERDYKENSNPGKWSKKGSLKNLIILWRGYFSTLVCYLWPFCDSINSHHGLY